MLQIYESKVKYLKISESGKERKVSANYILDAVNYTDAETIINQKMSELTSGEFQVNKIVPSNISEVLQSEGEWYWKAKITLTQIDEEAGKEKKVSNYVLVKGDDISCTLRNIIDGLSYMLIPYEITEIKLSNIEDEFFGASEANDLIPETVLEADEYEMKEDEDFMLG